MQFWLCLFLAAVFMLAVGRLPIAAADAPSYPRVSGSLVVELENDYTYESEDNAAELNDLYTTTEPVVVFHFNRTLSLLVHGVLEPVDDPGPREDRVFEDHGFFLEDIILQYNADWFTAFGGKFTPNFGVAWNRAPGVYGTDFAEDYEFTENVGFGGGLVFETEKLGTHTISASTFFQDYSILSDSLITSRGRNRISDGGVGNTGDFSSFAIAVDGGDMPIAPGLSYHAGLIQRAQGKGDAEDELGFAFGGDYTFEIGEISVAPVIEYARFFDADGVTDQERDYLTTAVQVGWRSWHAAFSRTGRNTDRPDAGDIDDMLYQVSVGYTFDFGLSADVGWKLSEVAGVESQTAGILFVYTRDFGTP